MEVGQLTGLENALSRIMNNPGKGNKGDKFAGVFKNKEAVINNFTDLFQCKIEQHNLKNTQEGESQILPETEELPEEPDDLTPPVE